MIVPEEFFALPDMNARLRKESGDFKTEDPLDVFLYLLMRDHLAVGVVEKTMLESIEAHRGEVQLTNGFLASYAGYVADTLLSNPAEDNDEQ